MTICAAGLEVRCPLSTQWIGLTGRRLADDHQTLLICFYGAGRMKRFATLGELRKAIGSDQKTSGSVDVDSRKAPGRKAPKMSSN